MASRRRCRAVNANGTNKGDRCRNPCYWPTIWDNLRMPLCAAHADPIWSCPGLRNGRPCLCPDTVHRPPEVIASWKKQPWPQPPPRHEEVAHVCHGPVCKGTEQVFRLTMVVEDEDEINNVYACLGCGEAPDGKVAIPAYGEDEDGNRVDITLLPLTADPAKLERIAEIQEALNQREDADTRDALLEVDEILRRNRPNDGG